MIELGKVSKVHCIGIGGIGVSAIARLFLARGAQVTGSDLRDSKLVQDLIVAGAKIDIGHDKKNLPTDCQLIIHTEDVNDSSPGFVELDQARKLNIETVPYSKALGMFMVGKKGIGVSGTNGKSTTTAMLALIVEKAGLDPSAVVGSKVPVITGSKFQGNTRIGKGDLFIVEADEYHRHMMDAIPWGIIITNIAADHLDYYRDLSEIKSAFTDYVAALPENGVLVYNSDDENSAEIISAISAQKYSFGFSSRADLHAENIEVSDGQQTFDLTFKNDSIGRYSLHVPGRHNLANAMAAALMALVLGIDPDAIRKSLVDFPGIWRRFEKIGKY
ncbi:MAG: UDP-N-acetylmuramate--L-alanine ligase, partial [Candidatus Doudnabacteria bacterium]|nr:UDP-N-acetylmuramate--L-alanine ligase [Candidatus Doudnabacteria bacterium]